MTSYHLRMLLLAMMMMMMMLNSAKAFAPRSSIPSSSTTRLYLEDRIAQMIDRELYRQQHHDEFEAAWMEQNREAVLGSLHAHDNESTLMQDNTMFTTRQYLKDKALADRDPQRYCADRCLTTGNCDVYEDLFRLTPRQVLEFCEECVLAEDDLCDVPEVFFEDDPQAAAEAQMGKDASGLKP